MIRNEDEYREARARVQQEKDRLAQYEQSLGNSGLSPAQARKALEPLLSFRLQLEEEIAAYERLKKTEFNELHNFQGFGQLLVSLRIAQGLTQRELAQRLGIDESQVSRDERNEYHNIGIDRAAKILQAMGVSIRTIVDPLPYPHAA